MKTITVKNVTIQFDTFDAGADQYTAKAILDEINEVLQQRFPDNSPIIFVKDVNEDNIEISDPDLEDEVEF